MRLTRSAHQDTFTRDGLPPFAEWPELLLPGQDPAGTPRPGAPAEPARLNCGAELLDRTAARLGRDRPAFREATGEFWSYGRLCDHVDALAHTLTGRLGVVPGNRVLLRGPAGVHLAACWLAVMKAGAVAVTVLPQHRSGELATLCSIASVSHALCDAGYLDALTAAGVPGLRITPYGGGGPDDLLTLAASASGASGPYQAVDTAADDVALIAFTSGTTGRPKGCMHFHRDVLAIADTFSRQVLRPGPDDVFAGSPPLGFTFGLGALVVFPLHAGASSLLLDQAHPLDLLRAVTRHRVSVLFTAPTAYRAMLDELSVRPQAYDLGSLRRCVSAGENLPAATWQAWYERTGLRIINGIGATELLHIFVSAADDAGRPGTTGLPVPGWQARIMDAAGAPVPDGEPGLLAVRGPVGCRYLSDPRQREYVRDGWNVTGDTYVREPDGYFRYVARADDIIVSAGYNVPGPEVEDVLLAHPDVAEAAVVGLDDERRGQLVAAYVVLRTGVAGDEATAEALRSFVRARLVPYKTPHTFFFRDALPRTATGKLQRHRLRELQ